MEKDKMKIGEAANFLGVTPQTLRNWDAAGKLLAKRSPKGTRFYYLSDLNQFAQDLPALGWAWSTSAQPPELPPEYYCERQDRFTSRLDKMATVLLATSDISEDIISVLIQAVGEIGDNSFAHNVGGWPDVPGIFFAYDEKKRIVVLADRGQGVLESLRRTLPNLATDREALYIAFTEIISGRAPEKRGNGLKVVRRVAESGPIALFYRSGMVMVQISASAKSMNLEMATENIRGTYAVITY